MNARLVLLSVFLIVTSSLSQEDSTWSFTPPQFDLPEKPTVGLSYGFSRSLLKGAKQPLAQSGLAEVKLGFSDSKRRARFGDIVKHEFHYLGIATISSELGRTPPANEISISSWRFAVAWEKGFGYETESMMVVPYNASGLTWSVLAIKGGVNNGADSAIFLLFDDALRFGSKSEGGIRISPVRPMTLDFGYERSNIFPRHLFWKWVGGLVIESIGQGLVDRFIDRIMDSSPNAVPVVNFILKNALSYGVYELRREKMNWPFRSAPPLSIDSYKVGLAVVF
jgi:hypothetical protein